MKKIPKVFRKVLLCTAVFLFLMCFSIVYSSIHISIEGIFSKISWVVVGIALWWFSIYLFMEWKDLSELREKERDNFVFRFPKKPSPSWTTSDSILADLAYDYDLDEYQIERIACEGVHNAVWQYRKDHPLPSPPSAELYETVFPYE